MTTPRPSSLPKLAACGQWESSPGTSDAAARGLMLDRVLRDAWTTGEFPRDLNDVDAAAVRWALNELMRLPQAHATKTDEDDCKIRVPGLERAGTADAVNVPGRWIADLKSGQIYDYKAQMAAYCLGLMHEHMETEWTAHLLFCDQQRVITHRFGFSEAQAIVQEALDNVGKPPTPCDYCDWCAKSLTCAPRVAATTTALATTDNSFQVILTDPERLGDFLSRCKVFEKFQTAAEDAAREMLADGKQVPGWRLGKPRSSQYVEAEEFAAAVQNIPPYVIIRHVGAISGRKAQQIFADAGLEVPSGLIRTKTTSAPLTQCN